MADQLIWPHLRNGGRWKMGKHGRKWLTNGVWRAIFTFCSCPSVGPKSRFLHQVNGLQVSPPTRVAVCLRSQDYQSQSEPPKATEFIGVGPVGRGGLRRGIRVGVEGVAGKDATVAQCFKVELHLLRGGCSL